MPLLTIPADRRLTHESAATSPPIRAGGALLRPVELTPSFAVAADDQIGVIGGDLARAVEQRCRQYGLPTPMRPPDLEERLAELGQDPAFTNKVTAASIRAEVQWACGGERPALERVLFPISPGHGFDLSLSPKSKQGAQTQHARHARRFLWRMMKRITECRVVFVALSQVEACRDGRTGVIVNGQPPDAVLRVEPGRFVVDVQTHAEVLGELEAILHLLTRDGHPDVRLVLAVSPTPPVRVARSDDPVGASLYDKAVLRSAAEEFASRHPNVDYFPAYEMAVAADPSILVGRSGKTDAILAEIADRFVTSYAAEAAAEMARRKIAQADARGLYALANDFAAAGRFEDAVLCFDRLIGEFGDTHDSFGTCKLRMRYGNALSALSRAPEAVEQFKLAAASPDASRSNLLKCVAFLAGAGESAAAAEISGRAESMQAEATPVAADAR